MKKINEGLLSVKDALDSREYDILNQMIMNAKSRNKDFIDLEIFAAILKNKLKYDESQCFRCIVKLIQAMTNQESMFDDICTFEYGFNNELDRKGAVKMFLPKEKSNYERKLDYGVNGDELMASKKRDIISRADEIEDFRNKLRATGISKYSKMADGSDLTLYKKLGMKDQILKDAEDEKEAKQRKEEEQKAIDWDTPFDTIMNLSDKDLGKLVANVFSMAITSDSTNDLKVKVTASVLDVSEDEAITRLRAASQAGDNSLKDDASHRNWGVAARCRLRSRNVSDLPQDIQNVTDLNGEHIYSISGTESISLNRIGAVAALIRKGLDLGTVKSSNISKVYNRATDKNGFVEGVKEFADTYTQAGKRVPEPIATFLKSVNEVTEVETNESLKITKTDLKSLIKEALKEALTK